MTNNGLDMEFVRRQKDRLEEMREELLRQRREASEVERERSEEYQDTQPDSGDESQYVFERQMDATLGEQAESRLHRMERALEKIEEGTYGVCDETGERIPEGRLEAMPEAVRTVEAEENQERRRRPAR